MDNSNTLGDIVHRFLPQLLKQRGLTAYQHKAFRAIARCRTPQMGGSAMSCPECGTMHFILHSCRDRHCPRCQGIEKEIWVHLRQQDLLPVKYYHVVFTVPHILLELFRYNRKEMYNLLFEKSWETLNYFAQKPKYLGAKIGAIAVLHTWDQQLKFHPHVHFIVPAGGINTQGKWVDSRNEGEFLFDVKQMSTKFSAIFASKLRKLKQKGKIVKSVPRDLIPSPWVVYAKKAFGGPDSILEYLARYTHRVAISNARIISVTDKHVTFRWCDRKNGYKTEAQTITGVEFLKRFSEHIVPPYFRRIRHLGFLSSRCKRESLQKIREYLNIVHSAIKLKRAQILELKYGERSLLHCRECGSELFLIEIFEKERAPPI